MAAAWAPGAPFHPDTDCMPMMREFALAHQLIQ